MSDNNLLCKDLLGKERKQEEYAKLVCYGKASEALGYDDKYIWIELSDPEWGKVTTTLDHIDRVKILDCKNGSQISMFIKGKDLRDGFQVSPDTEMTFIDHDLQAARSFLNKCF